jgi:dolichol-phosphate mannosyltransferase
MIAWMGYRTAILPYSPQDRILGRSKYSLKKMVRLAMDATFSFSLVPLYLGVFLGLLFIGLGVAEAIYVGSLWLGGRYESLAPGWSSLMFMLLIVGGTLATILGILGIYVGYIFQEVKRRPSYLIRSRSRGRGLDDR